MLLAEDVSIRAGQTAPADICLSNETTKNFTAYQFDLVLPAGIGIAKNAKGRPDITIGTRYEDDSQSLTVQKVEGTTSTYRVLCFSLANGVITGTEGALFTVRLQADADLVEDEYTARMENIVMTRKDGTQQELSDATLKITVNRITMGDTNGDNIVNVTDIVEVVNCIMGNPSAGFVFAAADLNGDGEVNVTDIVMMVNIIMGSPSVSNAETVDDISVCKHSYVLCFDDWDGNGIGKPGKDKLFGNGFFLDVTGGSVATNKGKVNLSVLNEADGNHVTQYFVDKYGADYPDDHYNSWRLKDAQEVIAMKVTAQSKLIFFLQGDNRSGKDARIPKISKNADLSDPLNPAPDETHPTTDSGFRFEWTVPDDMTIYIGTYNGDTYFSYLIVEANEAPGTPSVKVGDQTYADGLWFREVTCKANKMDEFNTVVTYTTDGTAPTAASPLYTAPIKCYQDMTVKFQAFMDLGDGKAYEGAEVPGAENEANVNFKFDAPTIEADGGNIKIVSPYEGQGAVNFYKIGNDVFEGNTATLTEATTVTAYTKIENGNYGSFTSYPVTKYIYEGLLAPSSLSNGQVRSMEPTTLTDTNDRLALDSKGSDSFGLNLHNEAQYVAAQMDIVLTEGQTLADVTMNRDRCESHQLSFQQKGENTYRVLVFSLTNDGFDGSDGSLLDFSVTGGTGGFSVENIIFVKADEKQRTFDSLYGQITGISSTLNDNTKKANDKWYDLNGRKHDGQPNRKGVYIRNSKKQTVR